MTEQAPESARGDADGVVAEEHGRSSVDTLLRNLHQQLVALSAQADIKANILISVSAILISILGTRVDDDRLQASIITLLVFLFLALVAAVMAVIPKLPFPRITRRPVSPKYDLLFFGHFARIPRSQYVEQMSEILASDGSLYRALLENLHNQGTYLVRSKYRWIAIGYLMFMAGFVCSGAVAVAMALT